MTTNTEYVLGAAIRQTRAVTDLTRNLEQCLSEYIQAARASTKNSEPYTFDEVILSYAQSEAIQSQIDGIVASVSAIGAILRHDIETAD